MNAIAKRKSRVGRPTKYRWDLWFNRSTFTLHRGTEYNCSTSMMSQQIRNAAVRYAIGKQVNIIESEDGKSLSVRVKGRDTLR